MHIDLSGKRAVVTGSTEGIGFAIARALLAAGAQVTVNGRDADKVDAVVETLGEGARGVAADLGTAEGCGKLIADEPRVDILIGNLGISQMCDFFDASDEMWDFHWQANVMANVRLARAYVPGMLKAGWGRVLLISSESAFNIPTEMIHYGVSKTALSAFARGLAKRLAGTGVTANSVLVGPTLTDNVKSLVAEHFQQPGQPIEEALSQSLLAMRPSTILQRLSSVEEIANMVTYLASPLSSATTGAAVRVDGGVVDTVM